MLFIFYANFFSFAQDNKKPDLNPNLKGSIPNSPTAAALGQYGSTPVSLHTGTPSINIPLLTLSF